MPAPDTDTSANGPSPLPPGIAGLAGFDPGRMAALAQVAEGIAPALSDLLTVIRGQTGVLLDAVDLDANRQERLKQIYTAAEKAGSLMRQLLIFSRQQTPHIVPMDLNGLIHETAGVLRRLLGGQIAVELRLAPDLPLIHADPGMLEQVLIILALNARDAMPTGGRLQLQTEVVEITALAASDIVAGVADPGPASARPATCHQAGAAPGKFVVLHVDDTGGGIAPDILPRIFEPFFTTKAGGRSIGLGLAAVFGIVQQHHGWVTAANAVRAGASFKVFLPVAPPGAVTASGREPDAGTRLGNETILLVEDDAAVREFTAALLQEQGYRVLQAGSGTDALETWQWHGPRVRLLLTDMVLEDDMTGLELAAKLRAENPLLKVICTSGHRRDTMERFPGLSGGYEFIQKPCRPQTLLTAMRRLLDEIQP